MPRTEGWELGDEIVAPPFTHTLVESKSCLIVTPPSPLSASALYYLFPPPDTAQTLNTFGYAWLVVSAPDPKHISFVQDRHCTRFFGCNRKRSRRSVQVSGALILEGWVGIRIAG